MIPHDDFWIAAAGIDRADHPFGDRIVVEFDFNGLAQKLAGAHRLHFSLEIFAVLQCAELGHLADKFGILLRIKWILGGELRDEQLDKILLIELLLHWNTGRVIGACARRVAGDRADV